MKGKSCRDSVVVSRLNRTGTLKQQTSLLVSETGIRIKVVHNPFSHHPIKGSLLWKKVDTVEKHNVVKTANFYSFLVLNKICCNLWLSFMTHSVTQLASFVSQKEVIFGSLDNFTNSPITKPYHAWNLIFKVLIKE